MGFEQIWEQPFDESLYWKLEEKVSPYNDQSEAQYELVTERYGKVVVRPATEPWALWHIDTFHGWRPPETDNFIRFLKSYVIAPDFSEYDEDDFWDMLGGAPKFFARVVGQATMKYFEDIDEEPVVPYLQ